MKKGPFKMKGFSGFSSSPMKQDSKAEKVKAAKEAYKKAVKEGTVKSNPAWRNLAFKAGFTNALVKKDGKFVSNPFSKAEQKYNLIKFNQIWNTTYLVSSSKM